MGMLMWILGEEVRDIEGSTVGKEMTGMWSEIQEKKIVGGKIGRRAKDYMGMRTLSHT